MPKADVSTSIGAVEKSNQPLVIHANPIKVLKRRGGRQSEESLMTMLNVDELFPKLKYESEEHADMARVLSSVGPNFLGLEEAWDKLSEELDDIHRDFQQMVFGMRLDPVLLFSIYQKMLGIMEQWLSLRTRELTPAEDDREMSQESYDALREEKAYWTAIIYKIKKMLVASR